MEEKKTRDRVAEYLDRGLSVLEISQLLGISPQAVYRHIDRLGLPTPTARAAEGKPA